MKAVTEQGCSLSVASARWDGQTGEPSKIRLSPDFPPAEPGVIAAGKTPEIWLKTAADLGIRILGMPSWMRWRCQCHSHGRGCHPTGDQAVPITSRNPCLVTGFGRVSQALARMLLGIGAKVFVAARNPRQLEAAAKLGCQTLPLGDLAANIGPMWVIFNTVPALVLTREILKNVRSGAAIIDLASAPGGTDFAAAREFGINAVLALGLPGKVAPLTAGEILASTIPNLIERELSRWVGMEAKTCKLNP